MKQVLRSISLITIWGIWLGIMAGPLLLFGCLLYILIIRGK